MSMSNQFIVFDASNFDVAIRIGKGPWPGLRSDFLMRQHVAPLASPAFIAEHDIREPADLLRVQRLAPNDSWWADWFGPAGVGPPPDRKSGVRGQSVSVRVDLGGGSIIKKTTKTDR